MAGMTDGNHAGPAEPARDQPGQLAGTVLVTAPGFDPADSETGQRLTAMGLTIDHAGTKGNRRPEEVAALVRGATAAIVSSDPFTAEVFSSAERLRVIARSGVGTDSIDLEAASAAGVVVTATPGLNDETCADHALSLILAAMRRTIENDISVRRGEWNRGAELTPWDLHGKRVGVVGYGRIGRAVVRRLQAFRTEIRVCDPATEVPADLACRSLADLLGWCEVLTIHVPLTPATRHLIGPEELAALDPGAVVVSTARGGVVDEGALATALRSGRLRGAALDVFETEPPTCDTWRDLPNVVLSPHIGGLSHESMHAMAKRCVEQVLEALSGQVPEGAVNSAAIAS